MQKLPIFLSALSQLNKYLYYHNTIFITTAELSGLSSAAYRNGISHSEQKTLAEIQLGVINTHMVDFCRPSHICYVIMHKINHFRIYEIPRIKKQTDVMYLPNGVHLRGYHRVKHTVDQIIEEIDGNIINLFGKITGMKV